MNFSATLAALARSFDRQLPRDAKRPDPETVAGRIAWQQRQMPAHLGFAIKSLTLLFDLSGWRRGNAFHGLSPSRQDAQISAWKGSRLGPCRDLVRFYESLYLLIALDEDNA